MQIDKKGDIPDTLTVKIDKLSNLGFGIAKYEGFVIFIEAGCPGDIAEIEITKKSKSYANAKITKIIEPSSSRVQPVCKMHKICGACQLQHIEYNAQLKYKQGIVQDTMKSILGFVPNVLETIPSPKIEGYRHKIQYPVGETKESKRILAGYYKTSSHELINIKHCPMQPEDADKIVEFVRKTAQELNITGYREKTHKGSLKHIVIRSSEYSKRNLVTLVINDTICNKSIKLLCEKIYKELDNIAGVCINYNPQKTNLILSNKTQTIIGEDFIEEDLCGKIFKVGAKTFFQVNPKSADNIFKHVKHFIESKYENPIILDAYAGITAFGICLSDVAKKIVSIEEENASVELAKKVISENNIKNIELHCGDAGEFFAQKEKSGEKFDVTIVDPPRKGCSADSLKYALKLTKDRIIYVSCNPATLARDLKYLTDQGAEIEYIQPVDMFPNTYHIENIAIIKLPS